MNGECTFVSSRQVQEHVRSLNAVNFKFLIAKSRCEIPIKWCTGNEAECKLPIIKILSHETNSTRYT